MITKSVIIQDKKESKDNIFVPGNIVKSGEILVMVTGKGIYKDNFSGISLSTTEKYNVGQFSNNWLNNVFKQFVGKVELTVE